jgi:hypothetical protein
MHGGEIFAEVVSVAALVVGGTWLVWIMIKAQDDLRRADQRAHGDANSPPAETFERGGTGAAGGRGASNAQQLEDACNKSRPLGLDH